MWLVFYWMQGQEANGTIMKNLLNLKLEEVKDYVIHFLKLGLASYDMFLNQYFSTTPLTVDGSH